MNTYIVLYHDDSILPADAPLVFMCEAENSEHAEEQCINAYPGCDVVWLVETDNVAAALADYYRS